MNARQLASEAKSGVYRLDEEPRIAPIQRAALTRGFRFIYLDGSRVRGKAELMRAIKNALSFPAHFGNNWDALLDMLRDLSWLPAKGYVLLIDNLQLLSDSNPADYQMAMDVLWDAAQFWQERRTDRTLIILVW